MRSLGPAVALLAIMCAGEPARCQDAAPQPVDLVRSLRVLQDRVTRGDATAHASQRGMLAQIAEQLARVPAEAWKDPKNVRAAVAFVLSGGNPRVLERILALGAPAGLDEKLVQGALAYGRGRSAEAMELLLPVNARTLDISIAGHVALIQSELIAKTDAATAIALLDEARLLSPGTLIEEAALRRQVTAVAAAGDFDRFQDLAARYLHRYPDSLYAGNFRRQFAGEIVDRAPTGDPERMARLELGLASLEISDQREIYLTIAREGLTKGRLEVSRFAARNAGKLAGEETPDGMRARLYEVVASAILHGSDEGLLSLSRRVGASLADEDAELLAAASSVIAEIRQLPPEGSRPSAAQLAEMATQFPTVAQAHASIERADQALSGGRQ
jgi:chemotaxis protein MotC